MKPFYAFAFFAATVLPGCGDSHQCGPVVTITIHDGVGGSATGASHLDGGGAASACPAVSPTVVCPAGAYESCAPGDTTLPCCSFHRALEACARPSGILTTECWTPCASGVCTVVPLDNDAGTEISTCCEPGSPTDPCLQPVG